MPRREPRGLRSDGLRRLCRRRSTAFRLLLSATAVRLLLSATAFKLLRSAGAPVLLPCAAAFLLLLSASACGGEGSPPPASATTGTDGAEGGATGSVAGAASDTLVDAAGVQHVFPEPADRIVSLVPSATITLRALGAVGALVGRTDYDTAAWAAAIPSVGGGLDPNLEAIVALDPDVVIRFEGEQDPRTPTRLDQIGIPHVAVRPVSLEQIFTTTELVGRLTGQVARADSLARTIRSGLAEIEARVADLPPRRVAYVLGGSPPWVSGPGTYIDEVLELVGGTNVFHDLEAPYTAVSPEELRTRDIDVVLVSHAGTFESYLAPQARVAVIGTGLENPGPGVVEAAWTVAEAIHGRSLR